MTSRKPGVYSLPPFDRSGQWLRGNLHAHSTRSDGDREPEDVVRFYHAAGYQFLACTEHRLVTSARRVANDFLVVSGIGVDARDPDSGLYHLVALGITDVPDLPWGDTLPMQTAVDALLERGGVVMLAHPHWSGQMSKDLLPLEGCFALEVYNGGCEVDEVKGFSAVHWDDLLATGMRIHATAVDDVHWRSGTKDAGLGWVWVKAPALTERDVLDSLRAGLFYASTGPEITDIRFNSVRRRLTVRCSPVVAVDFVGPAWRSRRVSAPLGEAMGEASQVVQPDRDYVRIACLDANGCWAWSNPLYGLG